MPGWCLLCFDSAMLDPRSIFGSLTIIEAHGQQQEFILSKRDITVGRAASSDIVLNDRRASRAHVAVACTAQHCVVSDAGSANGFKLNGVTTRRAELQPGDRLTIGTTTLVFQRQASEADDVEELETQIDPGGRGLENADLRETLVTNIGETAVPRLVVIAPGGTSEVDLSAIDALTIRAACGQRYSDRFSPGLAPSRPRRADGNRLCHQGPQQRQRDLGWRAEDRHPPPGRHRHNTHWRHPAGLQGAVCGRRPDRDGGHAGRPPASSGGHHSRVHGLQSLAGRPEDLARRA